MSVIKLFKDFLNENKEKETIENEELDNFFTDIFSNYCLRVDGKKPKRFLFGELELFFHSDKMENEVTFKRDSESGEIFFHKWGFDICFKSDENTYGGVLVRSLIDIDKYKTKSGLKPLIGYYKAKDNETPNLICGPLSCLRNIMRYSHYQEEKTCFSLKVEKLSTKEEIKDLRQGKRKIGEKRGKNEKNRLWAYIRKDVYEELYPDQKKNGDGCYRFSKKCIQDKSIDKK